MAETFYYLEDKNCILVDRIDGSTEEFIIESPNGEGIFDAEVNPIQGGTFIDGNGDRRKDYVEYELIITFYYHAHTMNLVRLLEADEVIIPISLTLKDSLQGRFVLVNDEAVYNFLSDNPIASRLEDEDYPYGSVELKFATVYPWTREDIEEEFYDVTNDQSIEDFEQGIVENMFDTQYSGDEFTTDEAGLVNLYTSEQSVNELEYSSGTVNNSYDVQETSSEPLDDEEGIVDNYNA